MPLFSSLRASSAASRIARAVGSSRSFSAQAAQTNSNKWTLSKTACAAVPAALLLGFALHDGTPTIAMCHGHAPAAADSHQAGLRKPTALREPSPTRSATPLPTTTTPVTPTTPTPTAPPYSASTLAGRLHSVKSVFPAAMCADDFMARVEMALAAYGFTGDTAIAMSNLCRDESCLVIEDKIEAAFGSCFSTHGLGGVLTCGVIGIKAGLSHSPVVDGKERYIFFSLPHIAIDSNGVIGSLARPNRPGMSNACGALIAVTAAFKEEGIEASVKQPGVHDPLDPELSILKQRLARRAAHEHMDASKIDLVDVTRLAERTIKTDLEYLISKAVDVSKADYAVITGIQIHNWAADLADEHATTPSLEFVSPGSAYVVIDGKKTHLDLRALPALSPRQVQILAARSFGAEGRTAAVEGSTVQEVPRQYLMQRLGGSNAQTQMATGTPSWAEYVSRDVVGVAGVPQMDSPVHPARPPKQYENTSFFWENKEQK